MSATISHPVGISARPSPGPSIEEVVRNASPSISITGASSTETHLPLRCDGRVPLPDEVMGHLEEMNRRINGVIRDIIEVRRDMHVINDRIHRALLAIEEIDYALHRI